MTGSIFALRLIGSIGVPLSIPTVGKIAMHRVRGEKVITRRDYLKQAAGLAAVAAMPRLLQGRSAVAQGKRGAQPITGKRSLKAHAAAKGLLTGCAGDAAVLRAGEAYRNPLAEQYNSLGADNCLNG